MKGLPFKLLTGTPTYEEGRSNIDSHGARIVGAQMIQESDYTGGGNLIVPVGGLLVLQTLVRQNPPGLITPGVAVPEVLVFGPSQGVVVFTLNASFEISGSEGVRRWTWQAELGSNLDSVTPDPPDFVFAAVGGSTNTDVHAGYNHTFSLESPFFGAQVQLRLAHDGAGDITVTPSVLAAIASGEATGRDLRLD